MLFRKTIEQRGSARGQGPPRNTMTRHRKALILKAFLAKQYFAMGKILGGRSAVKKVPPGFF